MKVVIAGMGIHGWSQSLSMQYNPLYARALVLPIVIEVLVFPPIFYTIPDTLHRGAK